METLQIKELMEKASRNPDDFNAIKEYADAIYDFLDKEESTDDILTIIIQGIDIDRAANYYDYLTDLDNKEASSEWKKIKRNNEIKKNGRNALKFITGILTRCFLQEGALVGLTGDIIAFLVDMIDSETKKIVVKTYSPVINTYFLEDIGADIELPKWETIKTPYDKLKRFAEVIIESISEEDLLIYMPIKQWAKIGIGFCDEMKEKQAIEDRIPASKISDLNEIIEHYKNVEKLVRKDQYDIAYLNKEISGLKQTIQALESEKMVLNNRLDTLNYKLENSQKELKKSEDEVAERKAINDAFDALKDNDIESLYKDIASALKSEYMDFIETESDQMDEELGEIYREKIKNIFKILDNKGIKVGKLNG